MLKIENVEVTGWEHAIRGMRNPKNSWENSDSGYHHINALNPDGEVVQTLTGMPIVYEIGPNDKKLMMTLRNAGTDHRKFMRMIAVYLDITAPLYWWKEFDTYKVGTVADSYNQKRTVMLNYEVLANMYKSRRNHKLDEWHILCDWMGTLPYSELITGEE